MITKNNITKDQAKGAISIGEFLSELIKSKSMVVIILTQDWCPQWLYMKTWLYGLKTDSDLDIYELEYNKVDYFKEFMVFKETRWGNYSVPYLRFYKDGLICKETNYIGKGEFLEIIDLMK